MGRSPAGSWPFAVITKQNRQSVLLAAAVFLITWAAVRRPCQKCDLAAEPQLVHSYYSQEMEAASSKQNERHVIRSPTTPSFLVATLAPEADIHAWIADDDIHWRLLRRYFLDRKATSAAHTGAKLVVDAGCNHGTYSLFAAAHGYRVICLEINTRLLPSLELSLQLNSDTGHLIWVQRRGVGATRDVRPFEPAEGGTYLLPAGGSGSLSVRIHPLDDFAFEPWDFLKIDVEGFEIAALLGSKLALENYGIGAMLIEVGPARWPRANTPFKDGYEVLVWLKATGNYHVYLLLRNGGTCPGDAIMNLGVGIEAGDRLQIQRTDDRGKEGLGSRGLLISEPFENNLHRLLTLMRKNNWDCNFWFEKAMVYDQ